MKIDLVPDRVRRRPAPLPGRALRSNVPRGTVEAADGVFAHLEVDELSVAEATRLAKAVPEDRDEPIPTEILCTPEPEAEPKQWSPKAIFTRLTKLYAKFTKPGNT